MTFHLFASDAMEVQRGFVPLSVRHAYPTSDSHGFPQHIGDFGGFYTIYTIRSNCCQEFDCHRLKEAEVSLEAGDYDTSGFWFHGLERLFPCLQLLGFAVIFPVFPIA